MCRGCPPPSQERILRDRLRGRLDEVQETRRRLDSTLQLVERILERGIQVCEERDGRLGPELGEFFDAICRELEDAGEQRPRRGRVRHRRREPMTEADLPF